MNQNSNLSLDIVRVYNKPANISDISNQIVGFECNIGSVFILLNNGVISYNAMKNSYFMNIPSLN